MSASFRLETALTPALIVSIGALVQTYIFGPTCVLKVDPKKIRVHKAAMAVETYVFDTGQLPRQLSDLLTAQAPHWDGPYIRPEELLDPWKRPLIYRVYPEQGMRFSIATLGADGESNGPHAKDDYWIERSITLTRSFGGSPPRRTRVAAGGTR